VNLPLFLSTLVSLWNLIECNEMHSLYAFLQCLWYGIYSYHYFPLSFNDTIFCLDWCNILSRYKSTIRLEILKNSINECFIKIASTKSEEKKGRKEEKGITQIYI
jgi:hypothetical protein